MKKNILILPCFNEEEVLLHSFNKLKILHEDLIKRKLIHSDSKICFVDDGSIDKTWEIISQLKNYNHNVQGIKLSRNFGHQAALIAGLESFCGKFDTYITIDADLQDDINVIELMLKEAEEGSSIVYAVKEDRKADSFFKRNTALFFYRILKLMGTNTIHNHADFRLIDNAALKELIKFQESNLYLRGIFPMLGFKYSIVKENLVKREYGKSKYTLKKMIALAWDGTTSISSKPLSIILYIGILMFSFSLVILLWAVYVLIANKAILGWFSIIFPTTFFGGVQMISIGIIGEYVGKIYKEIKKRPRYIIENIVE